MANKLFEQYKNRLAVADRVHMKAHNGTRITEAKKIAVARLLDNTSRFLTEQFENSVGTQRSDMGLFKKFALNLVNITIPNLIAFDLVITYPMSSMSGYVNYLEYSYGSNKGKTSVGDLIENPFARGKVDTDFTASKVEESKTFADSTTSIALNWGPVVPGTVSFKVGTTNYIDDGNGKIYSYADGAAVTVVTNYVTEAVDPNNGHLEGVAGRFVKTIAGASEAGTIVYGNTATKGVAYNGVEQIYSTGTPAITLTSGITGNVIFNYNYNNVVIPQNDLPILTAEMKAMPLLAKARRIAVYYSNIAAFQAKTDYGFDLGEQLAERAVAELNYEIDTEVVNLLVKTAEEATSGDELTTLTFDRTVPVGISMAQHFESFADIIEAGRVIIYNRTQKFSPNYMLIAPDVLRVISFLSGFKPAEGISRVNGPYLAGTYNGIKIFVSPSIASGKFAFGLNGEDMMSSAAVYAPYMPVIPTQLLNYADGGTTQGWSTMYDLKVLNPLLLVAGVVVGASRVYGTNASPVYTATAG